MRKTTVKKLRRFLQAKIQEGYKFRDGWVNHLGTKIRFNEYKNTLRNLKREWRIGLWE